MNITHNKQERGWIGLIAQKESKKKKLVKTQCWKYIEGMANKRQNQWIYLHCIWRKFEEESW